MALQDDAKKIINLLSLRLDSLFQNYGFNTKIRRSDLSIFNEILSYQTDEFEFNISACLHPHDYPNSLNATIIKKIPGNWKYAHVPELFKSVDKSNSFTNGDLMIYPQNNFGVSVSKFYEYCELVLKDVHSTESKINFR
jgi:hypothetical protein